MSTPAPAVPTPQAGTPAPAAPAPTVPAPTGSPPPVAAVPASSTGPVSAVDALSSALKNNIVPNQEYLLQGSILDPALDVLLQRLRGLCDNVDSGPDTFHDHEICFSLRLGTQQPVTLRVRRALDDVDAPWHIRYIGQPELGDKNRPTMVRSIIDVACSSNVAEFLTDLGFRPEFEFVASGYMFRKGRMKITVAKICKVSSPTQVSPPSKASPPAPDGVEKVSASHLVELSVLAPSGQDAVADDMKLFAEQLRPLVQLNKEDYRRL